jgi:hypothetical protein
MCKLIRCLIAAILIVTIYVFSDKISTFAETQNEFNQIEMELRIDLINRNNNLVMDIYNLYDFINLHRGAHNNLEKENLDEYYVDSKYLVHPRIVLINIEKLENINHKLSKKKKLLKNIAAYNYAELLNKTKTNTTIINISDVDPEKIFVTETNLTYKKDTNAL